MKAKTHRPKGSKSNISRGSKHNRAAKLRNKTIAKKSITTRDKNAKLEHINHTKKEIKGTDNRKTFKDAQVAVQKEELVVAVKSTTSDQDALKKVIVERDREEQPKLTGILNTNSKILEVLTKMYQKSNDDQDTGLDAPHTPNLPVPVPVPVNPNNTPTPTPTPEKKSHSVLGIVGGVIGGLLSGRIFKSLLKFSPLGWMMKKVKSFSKLLSKKMVNLLKYIGKIGIKKLMSIVKFVGDLLPKAKHVVKSLTSKVVKTGAKGAKKLAKGAKTVAKKTSKAGVKIVTKSGEKIAAKLAGTVAIKAGSKVASRAATAAVPIAGWVVTVGLTAMDAADGWKAAGETLGIDKEELTAKNKTAGALSSVLTLGFGSKALAKSINKSIGGEKSTIIKHYENEGILTHNTFTKDEVNFTKYEKLSSTEMKEIFTLDTFSDKDMKKMEEIITNTVAIENSTINNIVEGKKTSNSTTVNNEINDTFNKLISKRESDKSFDYSKTSNNSYFNYSSSDFKGSENKNEEPKKHIHEESKIPETYKQDSKNEVNTEKPINYTKQENTVPDNVQEAQSNKDRKETVIDTNSKDMVQSEINKTNIISSQLQQISVQNTQVSEAPKEVSGSDRVLNLFAQLT